MNKFRKHLMVVLWGALGWGIFFYPLWTTGVMHNDELLILFNREESFWMALRGMIANELAQGRILRLLAPFNLGLGFLFDNMICNRIVQSLILFFAISLMCNFFERLVSNKLVAAISGLFFLLYLPYTFESSVPQAYISLTVIPMIELLLAMIFYIDYIEKKDNKKLVLTIVFYILSLLGYEFMITFIIIFPLIYILKGKPIQNKKKFLVQAFLFGVIGIIYLFCLFGLKKVFPGNYQGTEIGFVSIKSSWDIIKQIIKSSLPGYFIFSGKYRFLFQYYNGKDIWLSFSDMLFLKDNILSLRIILIVIWSYISLYMCLKKYKTERLGNILPFILVSAIYLVIPILPYAISSMYQGNVSENGFVSLTINYYIYTILILIFSCIIIKVRECKRSNVIIRVILIFLVIGSLPIQIMNETFMNESKNNFMRYRMIENAMMTDFFKQYNDKRVFSADFYKTKNTLAIRESYWSQYAKRFCGLDTEYLLEGDTFDAKMYMPKDEYICIIDDDGISVVSTDPLYGIQLVQIDDCVYIFSDFNEYYKDNNMYIYDINRLGGE